MSRQPQFPRYQEPIAGRELTSGPWYSWFQRIDGLVSAGVLSEASADTAIAAICTALGSPDGTPANIPQAPILGIDPVSAVGTLATGMRVSLNLLADSGEGALRGITRDVYGRVSGTTDATITPIAGETTVTDGDAVSGPPTIGLADLPDSGVGAALVKITRDAKGRVEGTEAASLADLADVSSAAPTDGQVLTYDSTNGWQPESFSGGSGAMTLVGAATVAGSAATSLTLSGLDLATDGRYVVYGNFANATGSAATISLFYNGDTTTTNYYVQFWQADGATNTPARNNSAALFGMNASSHLTMKADLLCDLAGYPRMTMQVNRHAPSAIALVQSAHIRNNTANVTSLTFSSSVASALAVGSSFRVYKVS